MPILRRIHAAILRLRSRYLPQSGLGKAFTYILYTIVECCRRRGMDPFAYLRDVLTRLPKMKMSQVCELTPEAWQKAQPAAQHLRVA